jgi:hypothetical protein
MVVVSYGVTENKNISFFRLEFTTRHKGVDVNTDPLPILVKKLLHYLFATDPTLEIHPINSWPKEYTTTSSNTNHTEKTKQTTKKSPILTTSDTVPATYRSTWRMPVIQVRNTVL